MKHRDDIQGLRAIAVILVILNHLQFSNQAFVGGFIGVDVFFVISGFIITNLLIREYSKNARDNAGYGWISLKAFYFRRVKRIIPAATFVILFTVSSGYFLFNDIKAGWIKRDGFFASIFLANINLIQQKTDYFKQSIAQSPLEHYWSLSVEEQFYLVIPFLFLLSVSFHGLKIGKVNVWWERRVLALLTIVGMISFSWSLYATSTNPQSAYFSTFARAWEISAGSLLAIYSFQKNKDVSKKILNILGLTGLFGILVSSFVFNESSNFPGYLALVPVLSTVALIYAGGANSNIVASKILSPKPLVLVGEMSFSLYLWHLPIIVIGSEVFQISKNSGINKLILVAITFLLAFFSFRYIETPFRNIPVPQKWLAAPNKDGLFHVQLEAFFSSAKVRRIMAVLTSLILFAVSYSIVSKVVYAKPANETELAIDFIPKASEFDSAEIPSSELDLSSDPGNLFTVPEDSSNSKSADIPKSSAIEVNDTSWTKKTKEGLQLAKAPTDILSNLSTLAVDKAFSSTSCRKVELKDFQTKSEAVYCVKALAQKPLALFIGNSHGAMLQDAMGKVLNDLGYSQEGIFTSSCTISPKVIPLLNSTPVKKCKNFADDLALYVKNKKPELIIISEALNVSFLNEAGQSVQGAQARGFLSTNLQSSIKSLRATTEKIILLDAFPQLPNISTCMGAGGELNKCITTTTDTSIYREINKNLAQSNSLPLISPLTWLCYQGRCPAIIDGVLVSPDGSHVTPEFARLITPILNEQIVGALN